MRPLRTISLVSLLVLSIAGPASAQDPVLEPCGAGPDTLTLAGKSGPIDTPVTPAYGSSSFRSYVLDLSGQEDDPLVDGDVITMASLTVRLTWSNAVSDFDLEAGGQTSDAVNVLGDPSEQVVVSEIEHCGSITAEVKNFSGLPIEALTLAVTVQGESAV